MQDKVQNYKVMFDDNHYIDLFQSKKNNNNNRFLINLQEFIF